MSKDLLISLGIILVTYVLTLILTICVRNILLERGLLDKPNKRSSHKIAVPRGGGWALIIVLIPGMLAAVLFYGVLAAHAGLIAGTILLAVISWLDDRKGASVGMRLSMHLLAACIGSLAFVPQEILFGGLLPFWLDRAVMILGWVWFINLYNFMDGIDGIAGVETVAIATGLCILFSAAGINDPFAATLTLLLTGACLGFLALNWHPAKIFLGDIGSVPLGYLSGFLLLTLAVKGQWVPALILPLYYLADSGITLLRRAARHEKIWQAHREHFYQHAAERVGRHDKVVYWIIMVNAALMGAALLAVHCPLMGLMLAVVAVVIVLAQMNKSIQTK